VLKSSALGRIVLAGLAAGLAVAALGWTLERMRFGASDAEASARVEAEVQQRFDASADNLGTIAARAAGERDLIRAAPRDAAAAARLFDALDAALVEDQGHTGITVYDAAGTPLAWSGSSQILRGARRPGGGGASGNRQCTRPRPARIEPICPDRPAGVSPPSSPADSRANRSLAVARSFVYPSLAPVTFGVGAVGLSPTPAVFSITSNPGDFDRRGVAPGDLAEARARWRRRSEAAVVAVFALTLLVCAGFLVEIRRRAPVSDPSSRRPASWARWSYRVPCSIRDNGSRGGARLAGP
jgi:hypothetical protein